jgi:hypothetical protein
VIRSGKLRTNQSNRANPFDSSFSTVTKSLVQKVLVRQVETFKMQSTTPVARSPSKPRKSPKSGAKQDASNTSGLLSSAGSNTIESSSLNHSARQSSFANGLGSTANASPVASRTQQTANSSQSASTSPGSQSGSMPNMMSPLMFSSSAATLSHMQQLRLRQHNKAMLLRRLEDGSDLCNYTHRICLQNKLDGFDHCIRHILYDKNNTFRQCSFVHPQSHKRCPNAARKTERKEAICPWHFKKFFLKRKQAVSVFRISCD